MKEIKQNIVYIVIIITILLIIVEKIFNNEKINIIGVIANGFEIEKSSFKHKYGYGYGYKYAYEPNNFNKKSRKINKQKLLI
jgi:Mrp family chromosome partitioning ATPase